MEGKKYAMCHLLMGLRPSEPCGPFKTKDYMIREMGYDENFVLFKGIESYLSGWICRVEIARKDLHHMRKCIEAAGIELTVRSARAMHCSPQQLKVDLLEETETAIKVRGYEMCPSGLAREFLRRLTDIFPSEEELFLEREDCKEAVDQIWDVDAEKLLEALNEDDKSYLVSFLKSIHGTMKDGEKKRKRTDNHEQI